MISPKKTKGCLNKPCLENGDPPPVEENKLFKADGQLTVDVYETPADLVVLSTVAGITAKDLEIIVEKDMLIIKGCRQNPANEKDKNYFYQECYWGPFSRKIVLPDNVDVNQIKAEFNKGLLTIKFPKNREKANNNGVTIKES